MQYRETIMKQWRIARGKGKEMYAPICHHSATAAAGKWEVLIGATAAAEVAVTAAAGWLSRVCLSG